MDVSSISEPIVESFNPETYKSSKRKVILLAICFLILFSGFRCAQTLVGSIYASLGFEYLGLVSLIVLYVVFSICSFFANYFIQKFSYKSIFIVSSLGYASYSASGIWVCYCQDYENSGACSETVIYVIVIAGAIWCGFSASLIWIAQGGYLNSVGAETPSKQGALTGLFWSINQVAVILGAIVGTFIINYLSQMAYFLITTAVMLASSVLFLILPDVKKAEIPEAERLPIFEQVKNVFVLMGSIRARYSMPLLFMEGIVVSFFSGFLQQLVGNSVDSDTGDSQEVSKKLSYALVCLGVFEIISGLISGKLIDKGNIYKLASGCTVLCLFGVMFSFLGLFTQNYFVCYIVAAVWGFADNFLQTVIQSIANKDFVGEIEIYQVFRFIGAITVALFFSINLILINLPPYIYLVIVMACALLTNLTTLQLEKYGKKKEEFTIKTEETSKSQS